MNCDKKDLLLYAVTDRSWLNGQTLCEQVEQALKGGVTFLQLREKELDDQEFLEEAQVIQQLCRKYQVPFLINDNVALAAKIGADGVHVGQSDMAAGEARAKLGTDRIIGVSARTVEEALEAQRQGADYLEQDLVMTKDDHLVVLHDHYLDRVTDVADRFPDRARKDGRYYAIDFTLDEIKSLKFTEGFDIENGKK